MVLIMVKRSFPSSTGKTSPVIPAGNVPGRCREASRYRRLCEKTFTSTFTNEARINLAREDDAISQLLKTQKLPAEKQTVQMSWQELSEAEIKVIARAIKNLREQLIFQPSF